MSLFVSRLLNLLISLAIVLSFLFDNQGNHLKQICTLIKIHFLFFLLSFLLLGCSQKVAISIVEPAAIGQMSSKNNISILPFTNDNVGLSGMIEAQLAQKKLGSQNYFTLISRKNLDTLLKEQRLQSTELVDHSSVTNVGQILGVEAIITGEVTTANTQHSSYYVEKRKCIRYAKDKSCLKYKRYKVKCNVLQANLSANITINDVENAQVIYADSLSRKNSTDSCRDYTMDSKSSLLNTLARGVAYSFSSKLAPQTRVLYVDLIDSLDVDLSSENEDRFDNALAYIEAKRLDKAKILLEELLAYHSSYAIAYNLGIIYEADADLQQAKELYILADTIAQKPIDPINEALIRIDILINKRTLLNEQMNARN